MIFSSVEVIKTIENEFFIEWDLISDDPPITDDYIDNYFFNIYWSKHPENEFETINDVDGYPIEIDGYTGPLSYTHRIKQYEFNVDHYYKVFAVNKIDPNYSFFSNVVFIGMHYNGIHDTMRHAEYILYNMYHGEPCKLYKRKNSGTRCTKCWSEERQQRILSFCDVCNSTGFVSGFFSPIVVQISFGASHKISVPQQNWENVFLLNEARMSNYPIVRPKDLIVNNDNNKRFVISKVDVTKLPKLSESSAILSKQNYIISQILTIDEIVSSDNEYDVVL